MKQEYIANQSLGDSIEIDEIRWIINEINNRSNFALSGDPGNGKSSAMRSAAEILNKQIYSRSCNEHEQTYHYEGRPSLENNKVTYSQTQFKKALEHGGIFLNEETSEMPPTIQKYLSTLLTDDYLDFVLLDKKGNDTTLGELKEKGWKIEDFIYAETFNPPKRRTGNDNFELSHKSRINPFNFRDIDSLVAAYVSFKRIGEEFDLPLSERGVIYKNGVYSFTEKNGKDWYTTDGKEISKAELKKQSTYQYFDREKIKNRKTKDKLLNRLNEKGDFYKDYLTWLASIRSLVNPSVLVYDSLGGEITQQRTEKGESLMIVYPDQRIVQKGFESYKRYSEQFGEETARKAATQDTINKILHGSMKDRPLNGRTQEEYLKTLASEYNLIDRPEDATHE